MTSKDGNCRQFMYLVISLLVLRAGCGIWLYQFLIIAYLFTLWFQALQLQKHLTYSQQPERNYSHPRWINQFQPLAMVILKLLMESLVSSDSNFYVHCIFHILKWSPEFQSLSLAKTLWFLQDCMFSLFQNATRVIFLTFLSAYSENLCLWF